MIFGCLFLHKDTYDGSGCQTEYVCCICVDLNPAQLSDSSTVAEVESITSVKCRDRVYNGEFERFSGAYCFTITHGMLVVVRQNMCAVPAWTSIRYICIIQGLWRKFTA